jgi:mono/diheme cytochrome c family protein
MKQALISKPLVGLTSTFLLTVLLSACGQPEQAGEPAAQPQTEPAESSAAAGVTSIDADGNVAPFGMTSREPVDVPPLPESAAAEPAIAGTTATESALYAVQCVACHGSDAKGVEGLGLDLVDSELVNTSSAGELKEFLKVGRLLNSPDSVTGIPMPGFAWMADEQLDEIVGYIQAL